jgi:hypothetical protein
VVDLDAAWARIGQQAPEFVGYRSKTDREIPVVRPRRRESIVLAGYAPLPGG